MTIEYRVKPITRYVVTRYESADLMGSSEQRGMYDNVGTAFDVAYALCRLEHEKSGELPDSMNFIYPTVPDLTA